MGHHSIRTAHDVGKLEGLRKGQQVPKSGYPVTLGYETAGDVIDCGPAVSSLTIGSRVVSIGPRADYVVRSESQAFKIPDDLSYELAALLVLACDTATGFRKFSVQPSDRVVVSGAGAVGPVYVTGLLVDL
jgi:alcohol dehydrogenase